MQKITLILLVIVLTSCAYAPPKYSILSSNNLALRSIGSAKVNLSPFTKSANFDSNCRGSLAISAPDNMSFEGYIQKGLEEELRLAGMFYDKASDVTLSGDVEQLSFGSMRGLTGGTWDIGLRVRSTNGQSLFVNEHYEFDAGFGGFAACQKIADYYMQATQNVIGKLISSPDFKALLVHTR